MARRNTQAGGVLVAGGSIFGTVVGGFLNRGTQGLLLGFALGALAAVLVWVVDRARR